MENARRVALRLLVKCRQNKAYSNILLDDELKQADISPLDRRFVSALFYGVLERLITLERIVATYKNNPADKISLEVSTILNLGIYQLLYMDSVPESAAVNESVELAKKNRNPAAAGFVNAVLRSFIRDGKKLPDAMNYFDELSLKYSCPEWLVRKWINEYGEDDAVSLLSSSVGQAPTTLRVNTLKCTTPQLIDALKEDEMIGVENKYVEDCVNLVSGGAIERTQAYKNGLFHVQDIASQICCKALAQKENDVVLDVCSAPGGKAFTCCELANDKIKLYAFDLHDNRVRLIRNGAKRLGLSGITASVNNAKVFNSEMPLADKIICDVVCSGLGVIRRKPEIKYKTPKELEALPQIQYDILKMSASYLKVGGELMYSTCTVSKAENEEVVQRFLSENSNFVVEKLFENETGVLGGKFVTLIPKHFNSDGFFMTKLKRIR